MPDELAVTAPRAERVVARDAADVAGFVRDARDTGAAVRLAGRGTWLEAGGRVAAARHLDLSSLTGITEYVPGDLTLTARAGTTLAEIADATAAHGQWLPLDPFGDARGTLGATLATASAGPLGASVGLPRDVAVGVSFVSGDGEVIQGGGRVVKNVAGFDLVRLTIGAWGTLGAIVEATVRLRARPEADETFCVTVPPERDAIATLLANVRNAALEPLAAELLSPACAAGLGLGHRPVLLVRLAGNATGVHHQRSTLSKLATTAPAPSDTWSRLAQSDPVAGLVARVSRRPSELVRLWTTAISLGDVDAHATLARGIVRLRLPAPPAHDLFGTFDAADHWIIERAPLSWTARPGRMAPASDDLSRRIRLAFDSTGILNPGILDL